MTPPVANMDQKAITVPQVEEPVPPARRGGRVVWGAVALVLAAVVIGGAVLGAAALHSSQAQKQVFEVGVAYPQQHVPEHVTVDVQRNLIFVDEERFGKVGGLHYLHNFDKKLTAIHDAVNRRCYLTPLRETLQNMADVYRRNNGTDLDTETRSYQFITRPIDGDVLRTLGGEEIANHCRDVPSHWIFAQPGEETPSAEPTNTTVTFQCSDGGVFDLETFTCSSRGQHGGRVKRAAAAASLSLAGGCCCSCCCCCLRKPSGGE